MCWNDTVARKQTIVHRILTTMEKSLVQLVPEAL